MAKGIVRKIDELGRITLPMEYRRAFGVSPRENAPAVIRLANNVIRIELKPVKAIGLVRCLDELGRLVIPKEIRKSLSFDEYQEVDMYLDGNEICVKKSGRECALCGSDNHLLEVDGTTICVVCARKVVKAVQPKGVAYEHGRA